LTARIESRDEAGERAVVPLRWAVGVFVVLGALAVVPLSAPIVLAVWTAALLDRWETRWARRLGGRGRAAVLLTALVVVGLVVPLIVLGVSLVAASVELVAKLRASKQASDFVHALVPADVGPSLEHLDPRRIADFARHHGAETLGAAQAALAGLTALGIALVVYVFAVFECLANGPRAVAWLRERSLVSRPAFERLAGAFVETGRGLFVGIGGTALLQGTVATIGYALVGVPQPLLLGFVTLVASLIPSIGTALVWVPITTALFVTGRTGAGIAMLGFGCVASVVDNFVAPWLSRYGKLELPMFVVFVAMLGGIAVFGAFGLVLGPLFVRLGVEALDIWRERRKIEAA
jgi:predicted PurR-regulated permease PerM